MMITDDKHCTQKRKSKNIGLCLAIESESGRMKEGGMLDVSNKNINRLDRVPSIYSSITQIDLSNNQLSNLNGISQFNRINILVLNQNLIEQVSDLKDAQQLKELKEIWLIGNPITKQKDYIEKTAQYLEQLERVDGEQIDRTDKKQVYNNKEEEILLEQAYENYIELILLQQFYYKMNIHLQLIQTQPVYLQSSSINYQYLKNNLQIQQIFLPIKNNYIYLIRSDIASLDQSLNNTIKTTLLFLDKQQMKIKQFTQAVNNKIKAVLEARNQRINNPPQQQQQQLSITQQECKVVRQKTPNKVHNTYMISKEKSLNNTNYNKNNKNNKSMNNDKIKREQLLIKKLAQPVKDLIEQKEIMIESLSRELEQKINQEEQHKTMNRLQIEQTDQQNKQMEREYIQQKEQMHILSIDAQKAQQERQQYKESNQEIHEKYNTLLLQNYQLDKQNQSLEDYQVQIKVYSNKVKGLMKEQAQNEQAEIFRENNIQKRVFNMLFFNIHKQKQLNANANQYLQKHNSIKLSLIFIYWKQYYLQHKIVKKQSNESNRIFQHYIFKGWKCHLQQEKMLGFNQKKKKNQIVVKVFKKLKEFKKINRQEKSFEEQAERFNRFRILKTVMNSLMVQYNLYHIDERDEKKLGFKVDKFYNEQLKFNHFNKLKQYTFKYRSPKNKQTIQVQNHNYQYLQGKVFGRFKALMAMKERQNQMADQFKIRQSKVKLRFMLHSWKEDFHYYSQKTNKNNKTMFNFTKKKFLGLWVQAQMNKQLKRIKSQRTEIIYQKHILRKVFRTFKKLKLMKFQHLVKQQSIQEIRNTNSKKRMLNCWVQNASENLYEKKQIQEQRNQIMRKCLNSWLCFLNEQKRDRFNEMQADKFYEKQQELKFMNSVIGLIQFSCKQKEYRQKVETKRIKRERSIKREVFKCLVMSSRERVMEQKVNVTIRLERIEEEFRNQQEELINVQQQLEEKEREKKELGEKVRRVEKDLNGSKTIFSEIQMNLEIMQGDKMNREDQLRQAIQQNKSLENQLRENEAELTRKSHHYESINQNMMEKNSEFMNEIERLRLQVEEEKDEKQRIEESIIRIEEEEAFRIQREQEQMAEVQQQMIHYQSRQLDSQDRIETMQASLNEKDNQNQVLQQKVQFYLDQQQRDKAIHQSKLYNLQTKLDFLKAENKSYKHDKPDRNVSFYEKEEKTIRNLNNSNYSQKDIYPVNLNTSSPILQTTHKMNQVHNDLLKMKSQRSELKNSIQQRIQNLNRHMTDEQH